MSKDAPQETPDIITDRGFRYAAPIEGVRGYGGQVSVYESSGAEAPRVWIKAWEESGAEAVVHLEADAALRYAESIIRVVRNHYQFKEE